MERYKINIYQTAQKDLQEIVDYLNTLSPDAAIKYYDFIIEKIGTLTTMPKRYPPAKDTQLRLRGYRLLLIKNYIVFYIINEDTVEIRRIPYARRQYETLLSIHETPTFRKRQIVGIKRRILRLEILILSHFMSGTI